MEKSFILVFDADGTVFDSIPLYIKIFSGILKRRHKIPVKDTSVYYRNSSGSPLDEQFKTMLEKYGKPKDEIKELVKEFFDLATKEVPDIFDDVKPAFETLKNYKKIISTNTRQDILEQRILHHDLYEYLDYYFGVNGFKGKEEHFDEIKRIYSLSDQESKESIIFVSDGKPDMEFAKELGITGIGRVGTTDAESLKSAGAKYTVGNLSELPEILEKIKS
jgi:phosphoglycolate phosphatase-like HAD superfamily hydrolase